ncbi:MAG: hypothetical protein NVSMB2_02990 [Chloroflexota bacterium]
MPLTADERFVDLVATFAEMPGVTPPTAPPGHRREFGSTAMKVDGRIFVMTVNRGADLVFKLPARRVEELIASGVGAPFDANKGRPMREWVRLDASRDVDWVGLAAEALAFVRGRSMSS